MNTTSAQQRVGALEIAAVLTVGVLIGVMAIPNMGSRDSNSAGDVRIRGNDIVRAAHASAIAQLKRFPTVRELSGFVEGKHATATASGVELSFHGTHSIVATYTDSACTRLTQTPDETVACLGTP